MDNTHEWCAKGIACQIENLQNLPSSMFPWWMAKLRAGEMIHVADLSMMPDEASTEKEILETQDIKSLLVLPLIVGHKLVGYFGFDGVLKNAPWSTDDQTFLHIVKQILENAIERNRAEEMLKKEQAQLLSIFDSIDEVIYVADTETYEILYANKNIQNAFGKELIGGICYRELQGLDAPCEFCTNDIILKQKPAPYRWEYHNTNVNRHYSIIDRIIKWTDGRDVRFELAIDITETKRLQKLESRAERLETAGTIAGQVAHDFNNLLAPMVAYPEFIRDELPGDHPVLTYLDQIEKSAQKIADINQQLLTLGRRGHYNQDALNLNTIVHQAVKDIMPRLADSVTCETSLESDLMNILGGGSQILRVITNLLVNAVDALNDIGYINIKTENYYADDVSGAYSRVPKGEYVKLTISDNGCGISDDIVHKILDPFFSTKTSDKKRGSGLGLSVVDAVIKDHNGYLDLKTQLGKGTSFYIYFPATRKSSNDDSSDKSIGGNETILVVDDDAIQRDVSTRLLEKLGYEVSSVESGEKAIEYLRENPHNLVILDMIMPGGIDGAETYQRILKTCPNQKAIIVSGFSESDRVKAVQELGAGAFVKKPLTKKTFASAVRTELDKKEEVVTC